MTTIISDSSADPGRGSREFGDQNMGEFEGKVNRKADSDGNLRLSLALGSRESETAARGGWCIQGPDERLRIFRESRVNISPLTLVSARNYQLMINGAEEDPRFFATRHRLVAPLGEPHCARVI